MGKDNCEVCVGRCKCYDDACERCGKETHCEEIPMMGYSELLCRKCAAAAYQMEEAV